METTESVNMVQIVLTGLFSLIVGLIGLFVGVRVDRSRRRRKEEKLYVSLMRSIHYDYRKNLDLLCQLHAYLFVKILPSFSLELSRKDTLVKTMIPVCLNFDLLDRISHGYFELAHIQRRLDQLTQSYESAKFESLRKGTYTLINNDIRIIFKILLEIIDEIKRRTDKAEGVDRLSENYLTQKFEEFQSADDLKSIVESGNIDLSKRDRFDTCMISLNPEASGSFGQ